MSRTRRAVRAFEAFKGEKPTQVRKARLPDKDVMGWEMGPMVGVAYEARRDGQTAQYFHEFKKSARPRLVAQDDGRKLYIEGGRFKVTDRGIEDMPNLMIVNPSPRPGTSKPKRKGSTMARTRRRSRRRSHVTVFTSNPRRRRRLAPRRAAARARRVFATNPRRRRLARTGTARARVYSRIPAPRRGARRRYRRNPIGGAGVGKLTNLLLPAVFIGAGALGTEIAMGYLPIPVAWKTGPMRYVVKAGVGIALGLALAKFFKQKRLGYYFAAGAVAISAHDFFKSLLVANAPAIRGLGYTNPASVARFGQYGRSLPSQFGQYGRKLPSQFGGANTQPNARQPGGEMNFAA